MSDPVNRKRFKTCELCLCERAQNKHHLIPQSLHGNKWFKKRFSKEELRRYIHICHNCHLHIHQTISTKELGRNYNTLSKLMEHEKILGYVFWKRNRNTSLTS